MEIMIPGQRPVAIRSKQAVDKSDWESGAESWETEEKNLAKDGFAGPIVQLQDRKEPRRPVVSATAPWRLRVNEMWAASECSYWVTILC